MKTDAAGSKNTILLAIGLALGCSPSEQSRPKTPIPAAVENGLAVPAQQHFDDFADADGAAKTLQTGAAEEVFGEFRNLVYPYAKPTAGAGGRIGLAVREDNLNLGPDGRPGVLRFDITALSGSIDHFGLVYVGDNDATQIKIRSWADRIPTTNELAGTFLEFRYRALNETDRSKTGASYHVRFEPELEDSWPKRIDLGPITATGEWQVFAKALAEGTNLDAFIGMMKSGNPGRFKLVWGHEGASSNYQSGDSLLIDDIRITTHE